MLYGDGGVVLRRAESFQEFSPFIPLYELAFPVEERRAEGALRGVFSNSHAEFWLLEKNGSRLGFLNTWRFSDCLYVEHFAVNPEVRGQRIGEHALRALLQRETLPILIEVEPPDDEIKSRRKAFYERMGLEVVSTTYVQPSYHEGGLQVPLYLMSNDTSLRGARLNAALESLAKHVYGGQI